jgi:hypothetical protein
VGAKNARKVFTQQNIIGLEKDIRSVILYYEVKGCSALGNFRKLLEYIEVLLADTDENANKLMNKFGILDGDEMKKLVTLRKMRVD